MHLGLLAHLTVEPYKPFYRLSTKTLDKEIILDGVMELYTDDNNVHYNPGYDELNGLNIADSQEQIVNKDWLIRAKRDPNSREYRSLQWKFYRKDDE